MISFNRLVLLNQLTVVMTNPITFWPPIWPLQRLFIIIIKVLIDKMLVADQFRQPIVIAVFAVTCKSIKDRTSL